MPGKLRANWSWIYGRRAAARAVEASARDYPRTGRLRFDASRPFFLRLVCGNRISVSLRRAQFPPTPAAYKAIRPNNSVKTFLGAITVRALLVSNKTRHTQCHRQTLC